MRVVFALLLVVATAAAAGESENTRKARQELEQELNALVKIPAPLVTISYQGIDERPYELTDAEFVLDGKTLPKPALAPLNSFAPTQLWKGEVSHGDHVLVATVSYTDTANMMFSETAGYTWKVTSRLTFTAQRGLETRVVLSPERDGSAEERKDQFKLHAKAAPVMLAQVDDGKVPPPAVKTPEVKAAVDAGQPEAKLAAKEPEVLPAKGDETLAVKDALVKEPVAKKEPNVAPALRERLQKSDVQPAEFITTPPPLVDAEEQDAGAVELAQVDAGTPELARAEPKNATSSTESSPLPFILGGFALVAVVALIVVARRRANRFERS